MAWIHHNQTCENNVKHGMFDQCTSHEAHDYNICEGPHNNLVNQ
jgi:hypothetical protein